MHFKKFTKSRTWKVSTIKIKNDVKIHILRKIYTFQIWYWKYKILNANHFVSAETTKMSDSSQHEDQVECPLCMEPLDVDDLSFYPCSCGYQVSSNFCNCLLRRLQLLFPDLQILLASNPNRWKWALSSM